MKTTFNFLFIKNVLVCLVLMGIGAQTEDSAEDLQSEYWPSMKHLHLLSHVGSNSRTQWPYAGLESNQPRQSPVDLVTCKASNIRLPTFVIVKNLWKGTQTELLNNGHSVFVYMNNTPEQRPQLSGGPLLDDTFYFEQMHFHWGSEDEWGSEHFINGESFAAETHLVFWNGKHGTFANASKQDDGLAVLAVFAEGRNTSENPLLTPLQELLKNVTEAGSHSLMGKDAMEWAFSALSENREYYTYPGSLTTEPYSENVVFILVPKPIYLSYDQLHAFRTIRSSDGRDVEDNKRKLQPLHNRPVIKAYNCVEL